MTKKPYKLVDVWTVNGERHMDTSEANCEIVYTYPSCSYERTFETFEELHKYIETNYPYYTYTPKSIYIPILSEKTEVDIFKERYTPVTFSIVPVEVIPTVNDVLKWPITDAIEYIEQLRKDMYK